MLKKPEVGVYLDEDEAAFIEALEKNKTVPNSLLTQDRRSELGAMARATFSDDREKLLRG